MSDKNPVLFTIGDGMTPGVHFTLRDLFAMAALSGLLCGPDNTLDQAALKRMSMTAAQGWAFSAYEMADAMLAERAKR